MNSLNAGSHSQAAIQTPSNGTSLQSINDHQAAPAGQRGQPMFNPDLWRDANNDFGSGQWQSGVHGSVGQTLNGTGVDIAACLPVRLSSRSAELTRTNRAGSGNVSVLKASCRRSRSRSSLAVTAALCPWRCARTDEAFEVARRRFTDVGTRAAGVCAMPNQCYVGLSNGIFWAAASWAWSLRRYAAIRSRLRTRDPTRDQDSDAVKNPSPSARKHQSLLNTATWRRYSTALDPRDWQDHVCIRMFIAAGRIPDTVVCRGGQIYP